jgi:hypothetical protein
MAVLFVASALVLVMALSGLVMIGLAEVGG